MTFEWSIGQGGLVLRVLPLAIAGVAGFMIARWVPARSERLPTHPRTEPSVAVATPVAAMATPPPENSKKSIRERFTSHFTSSDPFGSAKRLLAEIDAMTAEDFRKLVQEGEWPSASYTGLDKQFAEAFADALVERWLAVDPEGSVAGMFRLNKAMDHGDWVVAGANDMLEGLARVRPELYLAEVFKDGSTKALNGNAEAAFRSLATKDIAAARRLKDGLPRPEQRKSAEIAIALGLAQSDPVAGVAMARELNNEAVFVGSLNAAARIGPGTLGQVLEANDGKFSAGIRIPSLMYRFPELPWDRLKPDKELADGSSIEVSVLDEARRLLPEERQSVLSRLAHLPPHASGDAVAAILRAWAPEDPKAATEWAFANAQFATTGIFSHWMTSSPDAALAWFATLPASEVRDRLGNTAAIPMAARGDIEQAMAYFRPAAGREGQAQVTQMALAQSKSDPARAAAWCQSLPAEIDTSLATESVVTAWFSKDAAAAAQWVESQPEGMRRESALRAYSKVASTQDAAAAGEWAAAIKDPEIRASAAKYVYTAMLERDRDEAAKWIAEFPGIDERVRTAVLRSQNP